jgi:membrane dipeptidase
VGPGPRDAEGVAAARAEVDEKLTKIRALIADNPDRAGLALSPGDVERLHREGKIAVIIGFQNARSLGEDLSGIDALYREGARIFGLNHAGHNAFSDSSRPSGEPVAEHGGLSPLGRQAVARLNDLGALIDVSQLSSQALAQTLELTRAPVAATHSNARALVDNGRNLSDAELDAIKAKDGIVQLTPFNAYLVQPVPAGQTPPRATVSDYVDQLDHVARRIGWRHVGIGTDFDHGSGVTGFDSAAEAPNVTAELVRRGYTQEQIAAIWGGNFLRVWGEAQAAARN